MKLPEGIGFTAEDFQRALNKTNAEMAAEDANAKLPALFEEWCKKEGVRVFGNPTVGRVALGEWRMANGEIGELP